MNFQVIKNENIVTIVTLSDKLTNILASEFRETFEKLINEGDRYFIIDLTHVEYMDSSGLGAIIAANNMLKDNLTKTGDKGKIVISNINARVKTIFSIFHMEIVLEFFNTREDAIKYLSENE